MEHSTASATGANEGNTADAAAKADEPLRLLGRDDILGVTDTAFEVVPVPEWGGSVRVRSLKGVERDEYEATMVRQRGKNTELNMSNVRAGLCARAICDANGTRVFSDGDISLLGQKSAAALDRVYAVASRLSKINDEDIEELAGNSASGRSDAPSSA